MLVKQQIFKFKFVSTWNSFSFYLKMLGLNSGPHTGWAHAPLQSCLPVPLGFFFLRMQKLWLCGHTMPRQPTVIHSWGRLFLPRANCCPLIEQIWHCVGAGKRWWNCSHSIDSRSLSPGRPAVGLCGPVMVLSHCAWGEIALVTNVPVILPQGFMQRVRLKKFLSFHFWEISAILWFMAF